MSHSGIHNLTDHLRNALICAEDEINVNKPDFRELDLGSPFSPLRTTLPTQLSGTSTATTATSSSSSSSGSVSGRHNGPTAASTHSDLPRRSDYRSHSGELSGSTESSPNGQLHVRPRHVRSNSWGSHQHIYSAGGGSSAVNSPAANVLPTGNICPSGRILKTGMMSNRTSKTEVLRSGTANYGHGSIMRGGVVGGERMNNRTTTWNSNDPEDLKRVGNENYRKGNFLEALSFYDKAIALSPGNAAYHCNRAAALMGLKRLPQAVEECEKAIRLDPGYVRAHHRLGSLFLRWGCSKIRLLHIGYKQKMISICG